MNLRIVVSGQPIGNYVPDSCSACYEFVAVGELMLLIDDGEYFPTFCLACVDTVMNELGQRRRAIAEVNRPDSTVAS